MSHVHNDFDGERVRDAAYRELWSQVEDGRGSVDAGARTLNDEFGDGAADGWFDWLVAETTWTPEAEGYFDDADDGEPESSDTDEDA